MRVSAILKPTQLESHQIAEVELQLKLPEAYKAYEDQFHLELESPITFKLSQYNISPVKEFYDDFSKRQRRGIVGNAVLKAPIEAPAEIPASGTIRLILTYQACTKSYCLFPAKQTIEIGFQGKGVAATTTMPMADGFFSQSFSQVFKQGLLWTFIFVFFAGVLTSLTPCVFPMIPITLAVLGRNSHLRTRWQSIIVSHAYVLGIAITYALLGLLAASTGALFGGFMSSPWVIGTICLIFLAMALSMLGLYDIQPPPSVQKWMDQYTHFGGVIGAFITGVVSGVVASPCVGPVLVGILAYVAKTQNLWLGFWLLFVFALGMGQLFLFLGISTSLTKKLPRSGPWLDGVKRIFGFLLLGAFFYYLNLILPHPWFDVALGLCFIFLGSYFYAFKEVKTNMQRVYKGLCHASILFGVVLIALAFFNKAPQVKGPSDAPTSTAKTPAPAWQVLSAMTLEKAKAEGKPVIIDFSADWCAACTELDEKTYSTPEVIKGSEKFAMLRFDATNDSSELTEYRKKFEIVGLPWVVFINSKGEWIKDLTLAGFEKAENFLERMKRANP